MKMNIISLILICFMISAPAMAAPAEHKMSDTELASYIDGRVKAALQKGDDQVAQYCDAFGCKVIVQ